MAKIKRSEANKINQPPPDVTPETNTPITEQEVTEEVNTTVPDNAQATPNTQAATDTQPNPPAGAWPVMPPPATKDPKDALIRTLTLALGFVCLLALGLGIALIMVARGSGQAVPEVDPTPTVATTPNDDPTPDPNPQDGLYAASAIHATAKPKKDAIIVEMHVDYHCGWCRVADLTYGPALRELSDSNQIDFRVQIRSFVNPESSQRAGVAAACAHKEGFFLAYHETIFNNQSRGQGGYSDEMLREEFAQQAGLKGKNLTKFQSCYDQSATLNDIQTMEREAVQMGINGTPAFIVNGVKAQFPLDKDNTQPMSADDLMEGLVSITTG